MVCLKRVVARKTRTEHFQMRLFPVYMLFCDVNLGELSKLLFLFLEFRCYIRAYNTFAFYSLKAKVDNELFNAKLGVYIFCS